MWRHALRSGIGAVAPFLWSVAAVALATIAGLAMTAVVPLPNVSMVLLLAVLFTGGALWARAGTSGFRAILPGLQLLFHRAASYLQCH